MNILHGSLEDFPECTKNFIHNQYAICHPKGVHICNGSLWEKEKLVQELLSIGTLLPLPKYHDCYLARTNPRDVARVESKTFMCTNNERVSVTMGKSGCRERIGNWSYSDSMSSSLYTRFNRCMNGRVMYVIPFCMGPLGSPLSKIGVQLTDSAYVVLSMGIMTTIGTSVLCHIKEASCVHCVHSVGMSLPLPETASDIDRTWPCNPDLTVIAHFPDTNKIFSFGSGYGGNSLVGKKCVALRIASTLAQKEGWLAEHMLIMGLTSPENKKIYVAAAFPSACGKTNLAMMTPTLPGWKVTCVGDDIAWMRFDADGILRAINPEKGFFGVCPGTSHKSNPVAMDTIQRHTIFTNVCYTSDGGVFWEGLEDETDMEGLTFTDWRGQPWRPGSDTKSSHPNSRFCSPITNCPILDEAWDDPNGVPISAIIFGGRRPYGVPLVYQATSWKHGVLVGASLRSETTYAASDVKEKVIVHDPFAMRPFFGYNCGHYFQHWLDVGAVRNRKLPKIFHANWFLKDDAGKFLWPGFGENSRVLKWIHQRCDDVPNYDITPIGYVPKKDHFDVTGLDPVDLDRLFMIDRHFWSQELQELRTFFDNVIHEDFPVALSDELRSIDSQLNQ